MEKRISVFTKDLFLFQKIKLDAPEDVQTVLGECKNPHLILVDKDTCDAFCEDALTMSRISSADIKIPFALGTVKNLLKKSTRAADALTLSDSERCAYLRGERIKLTEVEYSLLSLLISKRSGYASREEILNTVWNGEKDAGVINVYIHYLREKLEIHGEKIIISSRMFGYKIDEKFFGGNDAENN